MVRALVCILVLGSAASAQAQDALPLELDWRAPSECPDAAAVRTELARVAHPRAGYALTPLAAQGEVDKRGATYVLRLRTEHAGVTGERTLEAGDCETLVQSATLVLALAFGAGVELAAQEPPSTPETTSAAEQAAPSDPAVEATREVQPEPEPTPGHEPAREDDALDDEDASSSPLRVALLAGGSVQLALLPSPALALTLGVELGLQRFALHARATGLPGVVDDVAPDARARFDGAGGALLGCGALLESQLRAELCAGARVVALRGRAQGALEAGSAVAPWYALLGGLAMRWPAAGVLQLRLEAQLALALSRPRFEIENLGRAHRVPALAPELAALLVLTP